jgi:hypothetical protein
MTILRLFTDGSVNPKSKVGYGAYLAVLREMPYLSEQLDCEFKKIKGHKPSRLKNEAERFFTLVDKASRRALRKY